jgi:hypothetical protein
MPYTNLVNHKILCSGDLPPRAKTGEPRPSPTPSTESESHRNTETRNTEHGTRTKASTLYGILESYVDDPNLSPDIGHYAKQQLDSLLPF